MTMKAPVATPTHTPPHPLTPWPIGMRLPWPGSPPPLAPLPSNARQSSLLLLYLIWFLAIVAFAIVSSIVPLELKRVLGQSAAASKQGQLTSTTAVAGLILCPSVGYLSDRWGRANLIRIWCFAFFTASLLVVHATVIEEAWPLYVARLVPLSVMALLLASFAADHLPGHHDLVEANGYLGAAFALGMLLGSAVAAVIGLAYSYLAALLVAVACGSLALASALRLSANALPLLAVSGGGNPLSASASQHRMSALELGAAPSSSHPAGSPMSSLPPHSLVGGSPTSPLGLADLMALPPVLPARVSSIKDAFRAIFRDPPLRGFVCALALLRVGNVNSIFMFAVFTNYRLDWNIWDISMLLGIVGSLSAVWQGIGVSIILKRVTNVVPLTVVTLLFAVAIMFGYGSARTTAQMYTVAALGTPFSLAATFLTALITHRANDIGLSGFALGAVGSIQNFTEIFAGILFGQLLSWSLRTYKPDDLLLGTPYYVNSIFYLAAAAITVTASSTTPAGSNANARGHNAGNSVTSNRASDLGASASPGGGSRTE